MQHYPAFHLSLHCLQMYLFRGFSNTNGYQELFFNEKNRCLPLLGKKNNHKIAISYVTRGIICKIYMYMQELWFLYMTLSECALLRVPRWYFFCGSFMFFCLVCAMHLYVSVYMCLVVTCWERADLLALVCGV